MVTSSTESVAPTSRTSHTTKLTKPQKSRLIVGLVIASIIFVVLAFVVVRFLYHRFQRQKRAKYEDYGYSQLKVILDDNLYDDEEDDKMLSL